MTKYYAYLARCSDGTLYAGYTNDLKEREAKHNQGAGARYTRARTPIKIIYSEEFETKPEAMRREYEFKKLKKDDKEKLVSGSRLLY